MRRPSPIAIGSVLVAVLVAGCASNAASPSASNPPPSAGQATATSATPAPTPVEVPAAACPVPAGDYAGTRYAPHPAPGTTRLPASVPLPAGAQVFGTEFLPGSVSYLLGPASATCQGALASADGGEIMTAVDRSGSVTMLIRPGGVGPSTDLACPYIPAVHAADEAFRQGRVFCDHPSADVIRQIPTGTPSLYAAAVLVPGHVKDPDIQGSGRDPAVALYTAQAGSDYANGQMIACTLAPAQRDVCAASLKFFLATQAQIRTQISAANLTKMENALASFLAATGPGPSLTVS